MQKFDGRKFQLVQLGLVKAIDQTCKELGIHYYIVAGTLLGAVRHGGFIPWDSDIDIAMRRTDYEILRSYWLEHEEYPYFWEDYSSDPNHLSPHALLRIKDTHVIFKTRVSEYYKPYHDGIYMDILPLDEPPADPILQRKQMRKIRLLKRLIELKIGYLYVETSKGKRVLKRIVHSCLFPFSLSKMQYRLDKVMQKYSGCNSGYLVSMASRYSYEKQLMSEDIYGTPSTILFEGIELYAPAQIDAYLTQLYGDYHQLPPKEKRQGISELIADVDYGDTVTNND